MVTSMLYLTLAMNYLAHAKYRRFPINTQFIGPPLDLLPVGNFASLSYLKEDFKLLLLIYVYTMFAGALVSDSLLHILTF